MNTKEIEVLKAETSPLIAQAETYVIDSVESVEAASEFLRKVKDLEKLIEDKRTEITKPINESLKSINNMFKELSAPLVDARTSLSQRILTWKQAENERIAKEEQRRQAIQEAHKEAGHNVNAPVTLDRTENKIGNTQTRKVWRWRTTDFAKLSDEFKTINSVAINQQIRNGVRHIEGLEIYQEELLSIV